MEIQPIAVFHSPFSSKFGIPKQSGLVEELAGTVVFNPEYRNADALRGIDGFSFLWLIWGFSANKHSATSPVVRPPLLGGNVRMGVFATRSPFRPNPLGLSSVRLERVEWESAKGPVLHVLGADLMDGTPIYDIKPYVGYTDCHEHVRSGFTDVHPIRRLKVIVPDDIRSRFSEENLKVLVKTLELDPRPRYQQDAQKVYGMPFGKQDIRFTVSVDGVLRVVGVGQLHDNNAQLVK
ncbi:tRNA (N6-threonylcarbamoyladenosine(37)-N6)-methyltransferase TrmO [Hallella bergensis]|uniref:tRNA (N6-threonylcarbamoyladenosine(37)-N6)-methyltransferase TrmO n=1 Tax=Hallella bergensis TaxID=242750 RepID=UPI0039908029